MFKKLAIAATLSLISAGAFAAEDPKWYVGADLGLTTNSGQSGHNVSKGIFAGYQFNETFAVEAGVRRLASRDILFMRLKEDQYSISALASVPINDKLKAYGRLGVTEVQSATRSGSIVAYESSKVSALYGFGLSYAISPRVTARMELQKPSSQHTNLSTGLAFKF